MPGGFIESEWIWRNGAFCGWREAGIHVLSGAVQFGLSVFEGIRCYATPHGPAIFRLDDHMRRLRRSCAIYGLKLEMDDATLAGACREVVRVNALTDCYIRPMVLLGYGAVGLDGIGSPVEVIVPAWQWGAYLGEGAAHSGIDVGVSSWHRPAPNSVPAMAKAAGHYTNANLMKREARRHGYAEAIALAPDGTVSEGSGQNIFAVRGDVLHTPPIGGSNLEGITRDSVMVLARERGLTVTEGVMPRDLLYVADELFLTGTASEIVPVRSVDGIIVGRGEPGVVTAMLRDAFADAVRGRDPRHAGWLTYVDAAPAESEFLAGENA